MINLICNKYWFSLIKAQEIDFDYREVKKHYIDMFVDKIDDKTIKFKDIKQVKFVDGYSKNRNEIIRNIANIKVCMFAYKPCFILTFEPIYTKP